MTRALVLASNSPRRRQLLALTGRDFSLQPASIDERPFAGEHPGEYVLRLARAKAAALPAATGGLILGSDTTVADDMEILGKPEGEDDARRMLRQLRDREHIVYTAVALRDPLNGQVEAEVCASRVYMRDYSDTELEAYVRSGNPLDKAGAYAIQHPGFHPVEGFAGCYASVMGLPLCHVERILRRLDGPSPANVPSACQAHLAYDCPVSAAILRGEDAG